MMRRTRLGRILWALVSRWRWLYLYAALLVISHLVIALVDPRPFRSTIELPGAERITIETAPMTDAGETEGDPVRLSLLRWSPDEPDPDAAPVMLFHGCPSRGGADFHRLAPILAERSGRTIYALDAPGFGRSDKLVPSFSILATARYALAAMDQLGLDRVHAVGWSLGGGSAIYLSELSPERIASVTLISSIGAQETEGSGDYYFEHGKYAFGFLTLVALPEFLPHFGLLGPRSFRHAFIRSFWDTDQRPVRAVMERLERPSLIIHGRSDVLTPAWGAELHHQILPDSRLVMLDANHFLPLSHPEETANHLIPFLQRHDDPLARALPGRADFAPLAQDAPRRGIGRFEIVHGAHWLPIVLIIIFATFISEDATVIGVGILIASGDIDFAVGFLGCLIGIATGDLLLWMIGRFAGRPALRWPILRAWLPEKGLERWGRMLERHAFKAVMLARVLPGTRMPLYITAGMLSGRSNRFIIWAIIAALIWTPFLLTLSAIFGPVLLRIFERALGGGLGLLAALAVILISIRIIEMSSTRLGRRRLRSKLRRLYLVEFWPPVIFYLPLIPWIMWLALRHRGLMTFTCANPGVPNGGGVINESKHQIMRALSEGGADRWLTPSKLIPAEGLDPLQRAELVERLIHEDPAFTSYPLVLKPDAAQRAHGVKLVRSREDVQRYFQLMTRPAIAQPVHPGPCEVGVLWARRPGADLDEPGFIFSITRKEFPIIEGDGRHSLEELIWSHPRYSMQARTFLKRFADQTDRVLFKGERLRLAFAGNHCQGVKLLDGADLITPEFVRQIDEIARGFPDNGFDFGRFDIRYESEEALKRGEGFGVIELNGVMSESTNIYDPGRSTPWRYWVLFRQWSLLYKLGAARRRAGCRPIGPYKFLHTVRDHYRGRPGSSVSD
ncbi:MAG: alpha/beta fold hydrolase [Phycisphaeraceae bacterium]|nr:MAG: alpha/beta fold hydrolase [Phycisphaeraceae bacterium]